MNAKPIRRICVFCGSSLPADARFVQAADTLGRSIAEAGLGLVYGGGNIGLMGRLSRAAMSAGGQVVGVIPEHLHAMVEAADITELLVVPDMHSRKEKMYELSDAFVALPGGIGTLEELCEVFTWQQLGYHAKPLALLNCAGFYDPLIAMFDTMVEGGFLKRAHKENLLVVADAADTVRSLVTATVNTVAKLPERRQSH